MEQVDALLGVLEEETRACEALARVLGAEQAALITLRPQAILSALAERRGLERELVRLAARRRELVREAAAGSGAATAYVTALLPRLPAARRACLGAGLGALRRALLVARGLERQNARLTALGLDAVRECLRALGTRVPGVRYGADATLTPTSTRRATHARSGQQTDARRDRATREDEPAGSAARPTLR